MGWIKGRKFCHVKVTRPRFKAGSIKFAGSNTWAFDRFDLVISSRSPSGQSSDSAASGAEMPTDSIGACGAAGAAIAVGTTGGATGVAGFGAPLPLLLLPLLCGTAALVSENAGMQRPERRRGRTNGSRRRAMREGGGGCIREGGVGTRIGGVGIRIGGVGEAAGDLTGGVEMVIPCPRAPNGLPTLIVQFDLLWRDAAGKQRGIQPAEDFIERQHHRLVVVLAAGINKYARSRLSQFPKSDFHRAAGELGENFFQRNGDDHPGRRRLHDFRAQFHGQRGNNGLQGQLQFIVVPCRHGCRRRRLLGRGGNNRPDRHRRAGGGEKSRRFRRNHFVVIQMAQQAPEQPGNFYFYSL